MTTPNHDLISRSALNMAFFEDRRIHFVDGSIYGIGGSLVPLYQVHELILSMPTIEAEPVRHDGCEFCKMFDFSEARCTVEHGFAHISLAVGGTRFPIHERFNFCPNCGAKMDAKEETT